MLALRRASEAVLNKIENVYTNLWMWNLHSSSRNVCPFNGTEVKGNYIDSGAAEIACIGMQK
jgi:hypothetical protein